MLAAVDLGSNSFRLQVARIDENGQLRMLDSLREPVRLAAGLSGDRYLDQESQQRALACLNRFGERLRHLPRKSVRAVGTNSLRVAKNSAEFLPRAEEALGFPIEVIAGREEARLIYLGAAHSLPPSTERRMVMDIGGGSTEFIVGQGLEPLRLESLYMGCVSYTQRFFPDGRIGTTNLGQAELAARNELQPIVSEFAAGHWEHALGSSGTARAFCDLLEQNGLSESGITREGLEQLRTLLLNAGAADRLGLQGLAPDRIPVLAGGFAIIYATFCELGIERMQPVYGALREGVLHDLLGRVDRRDMRDETVRQFMRRYGVDESQAARVARLARQFALQFLGGAPGEEALAMLEWAASLHEIGVSIARNGYHKHTGYILANADMPGFSRGEQSRLSLLARAHRGSLGKLGERLGSPEDVALVMSLRLAALFCRNRADVALPELRGEFTGNQLHLALPSKWLAENQVMRAALEEEARRWQALEVTVQLADR